MSRPPNSMDPSRFSNREGGSFRRMSSPLNSFNTSPDLGSSRTFSPPPTPRSTPIRPDRLSLRLRSNSTFKPYSMAESPTTPYSEGLGNGQQGLTYNSNGYSSSSIELGSMNSTISPSRLPSASSRQSVTAAQSLNSWVPLLDSLGRETFQMAMENSSVAHRMLRYCEDRGCDQNMDFLMKIQAYHSALNDMTTALTSISTTYTSIGATVPLNLPPMLSRPLNSDIKRIAHSIIPSLEAVFFESRSHIERDVVQDIFPGFVKKQLVNCTAAELASGNVGTSARLQYPGLGSCFCMTAPSDSSNPIIAASEDFQNLTGYPLKEAMGQGCHFLQGPVTDPDTIMRIQIAMRDQRESVELILNHHKDGEPFWNLLFILPLKDTSGVLKYWLGGQIDVSGCLGNQRDLLRVLNGGQPLEADSTCESTAPSEQSSGRDTSREGGVPSKSSQPASRKSSRTRSSSISWLKPSFRRQTVSRPSSPPSISEANDAISIAASKKTNMSQMSPLTSQPPPSPHSQVIPTAYLNYMLLKCVQSSEQAGLKSPAVGVLKKSSVKLIISFYSEAAVELLSVQSDVSQCSIFSILGDKANSPSVTRSFKNAVRESVERGESISLELQLERARKRGESLQSSQSGNTRPTPNELENARYEERVDKRQPKAPKYENLWSHWTPLRDANGNVDWVVLLISPGI